MHSCVCVYGTSPNPPRLQRTPSASPPSPLSRKPLGRTLYPPSFLRPRRKVFAVFALVCATVGCNRYVDRRVDETTYFVQEIRKGAPSVARSDQKADDRMLCHLAELTVAAGYDSFQTVPSGSSPDLQPGKGEFVSTATIRMFKGVPPLLTRLPEPGE